MYDLKNTNPKNVTEYIKCYFNNFNSSNLDIHSGETCNALEYQYILKQFRIILLGNHVLKQ